MSESTERRVLGVQHTSPGDNSPHFEFPLAEYHHRPPTHPRGGAEQKDFQSLTYIVELEHQRWKAAIEQRERELELAASAVQRAVRSLEAQRCDFQQRQRQQLELMECRYRELQNQVELLAKRLEQQEATSGQLQRRLRQGLQQITRARRRSQRQQRRWDQQWELRTQQLAKLHQQLQTADGLVGGDRENVDPVTFFSDEQQALNVQAASDDATQTDLLSYDVCDRLILRERSLAGKLKRMAAAIVLVLAGVAGGLYLLWTRL